MAAASGRTNGRRRTPGNQAAASDTQQHQKPLLNHEDPVLMHSACGTLSGRVPSASIEPAEECHQQAAMRLEPTLIASPCPLMPQVITLTCHPSTTCRHHGTLSADSICSL